MRIPTEQLLNLPDIQVLNVEIGEHEIRCDIAIDPWLSICHRCGQKATKFFEHGETISLRHLPICDKDVYLYLKRSDDDRALRVGTTLMQNAQKPSPIFFYSLSSTAQSATSPVNIVSLTILCEACSTDR